MKGKIKIQNLHIVNRLVSANYFTNGFIIVIVDEKPNILYQGLRLGSFSCL
jgi:hypothetical protein